MKDLKTLYIVPCSRVIFCSMGRSICQASPGLTFGPEGEPGAPYNDQGEFNF